jgi:GH24 family phage-related lysozyme (muramidase)
MNAESLKTLKLKKEEFENRVPWMYLDQFGHLTIGIGHKVASAGADETSVTKGVATVLKFGQPRSLVSSSDMLTRYLGQCQTKELKPLGDAKETFFALIKDGSLATVLAEKESSIPGVWGFEMRGKQGEAKAQDVMVQEAMKIMGLSGKQKDAKSYFECFNTFELPDDVIDSMLDADIQFILSGIKNNKVWVRGKSRKDDYKASAYPDFAEFDAFPEEVQMALVDLAFQAGLDGLYNLSRGKLREAVKSRAWSEAATLIPNNAQASRVSWRRGLFETAAKTDPKAKKPDPAPGAKPGTPQTK